MPKIARAHGQGTVDTVLVGFVDDIGLPTLVRTLWDCDAILHHSMPVPGSDVWEVAVALGTGEAAVACFSASPNVRFSEPDALGDLDDEEARQPAYDDSTVMVKFVDGIEPWRRDLIILACQGIPKESEPLLGSETWKIALQPGMADFAVDCLNMFPRVEFAEFDFFGSLDYLDIPRPVAPNDPCFDTAINDDCLDETQYAPRLIRADLAWTATKGNPDILIGVLDSGIHVGHPDLRNKYILGYDFGENDDNPSDEVGHGTQVSGIAAAASDNNLGISSIGYDSKLLAVKVTRQRSGSAVVYTSDLAAGIYYAIDHGADIINMSLGFSVPSQTLGQAVAAAWEAGLVLVASSGNTGKTEIRYPAGYPQVIGVGSIDETGNVVGSSTCGAHVSVVAPGEKVLSSDLPYEPFPGWTVWYGPHSGTSMAAPHVAGSAALILSENPHLTNAEVRAVIEHTAVDISAPGIDLCSGAGRIDAYPSVLFDYTELAEKGYDHASHLLSPDADNDGMPDLSIGSSLFDQDGIDTVEDYDGGGSYSLEIKVNNHSTEPAQLVGWIDFDQDGVFANDFESGERSNPASGDKDRFENANVPPEFEGMVRLTWAGKHVEALPSETTLDLALRLRLTTDSDFFTNASPHPSGLALGGDIDDGEISVKTSDGGSLAVTLGYFHAEPQEALVKIHWQTSSENGVAGFNLLAVVDGMLAQLNDELIASPVIDSIFPTDYSLR